MSRLGKAKYYSGHDNKHSKECICLMIYIFAFARCAGLQAAASVVKRTHSSAVKSAAELQQLAEKSRLQQRGSKSYRKAWTHWKHLTVDSIRYELEKILPDPVNEGELEFLSFSLGVAADTGEMPSFEAAGARSGYALDYFCRALLLADLLMNADNPTLPDYWGSEVVQRHALMRGNRDRSTDAPCCNVTSLGGGPGFDFVACALVSAFGSAGDTDSIVRINATILDYEPGWGNLVGAMNEATNIMLPYDNKISSRWGGVCDITKTLDHPSNAACLEVVNSTTIWTCQYCVAENAKQLRDSGYVFFRDLFQAATVGSLFIITETTPRLWPEFYELLVEYNAKNDHVCLKIGFPYVRGPHMAIYKTDNINEDLPAISDRDMEKLRGYETYSWNHEKLMETGWERQKSKRFSRNIASTV
jgi:hypothetical protein